MQPHHTLPAHVAPAGADDPGAALARTLLERLLSTCDDPIAAELGDGAVLYKPAGVPRATIIVRDLGALRALVLGPASLAAARAVVRGDLGVRGDVEAAIAAVEQAGARVPAADRFAIGALAARLPAIARRSIDDRGRPEYSAAGRKHSPARDREAIAYHYDVSNDFYALWLGREMVYSSAYFRDPDASLDQAQRDKLDHICRKLRLHAGERLLDIGCGWGGLIRFAAKEYGAVAIGVTLSARQAEYAKRQIDDEGLGGRCRVELRDYRELAPLGPFEKVASVGMVEHVGTGMLPAYFRAAFDALVPGGLFLNHGISSQRPLRKGVGAVVERLFPKRSTFIERYVFPDGDLPRIGEIVDAAEGAGFEVRDVENLREHYVRTLRLWVSRLEANEAAAKAAVGEETYNVWRFYMAGSAHGFAVGRMGLDQTLLAKPHADGRADVPATRADLYEPRRLAGVREA